MSKTMQVRDEASDIKKQLLRVYKKSVSTIGSDPLQLDLNLNDTKRSETMIWRPNHGQEELSPI